MSRRRPETMKIAARRCPTSCQLVVDSGAHLFRDSDKLAACRTFSNEDTKMQNLIKLQRATVKEISSLAKKVFDISIRRAALALAVGTLTAFSIFPGTAVPLDQTLNQITSCVEVPPAVVAASHKRASSRSDCDPQTAFDRAQRQSQKDSRDALAPVCRNKISAAEAEEICRAAGGSRPTAGTSLQASPVARAGGARIDSQLHITQSNPKLCVVLRDVPDETETKTQPAGPGNGFCVLNNGRVTTKKVRTRARCGVECFGVN